MIVASISSAGIEAHLVGAEGSRDAHLAIPEGAVIYAYPLDPARFVDPDGRSLADRGAAAFEGLSVTSGPRGLGAEPTSGLCGRCLVPAITAP